MCWVAMVYMDGRPEEGCANGGFNGWFSRTVFVGAVAHVCVEGIVLMGYINR